MSLLPLKKMSDEVYVASDDIVRLNADEISFIRDCAQKNARGRARICAHKSPDNKLHEMLIGISDTSYIRPHRHHGKIESFHLVEGQADIVILSDQGELEDVIELGADANFYYRLDSPRYHTLVLRSPVLVIHETTNGPFNPDDTDWGAFSPPDDSPEVSAYSEKLRLAVSDWKAAHFL